MRSFFGKLFGSFGFFKSKNKTETISKEDPTNKGKKSVLSDSTHEIKTQSEKETVETADNSNSLSSNNSIISNGKTESINMNTNSIASQNEQNDVPTRSARTKAKGKKGSNPSEAMTVDDYKKMLQKLCTVGLITESYDLNTEIGKGSTASVFRAINRFSREKVAIKDMVLDTANKWKMAVGEINLLKNFRHPNIVKFHECFLQDNNLLVVLEFCGYGELTDFVTVLSMKESIIARIDVTVLSALKYLHENGIIHRDIKSDNILVTEEGDLKLSDFGYSVKVENESKKRETMLGTAYWMAPEILNHKQYGNEVDIWSFGIFNIELIDGAPPHLEMNQSEAMGMISRGDPPNPQSDTVSDSLKDFLSKCLVYEPSKRWTTGQLLEHPFLRCAVDIQIMRKELVDSHKVIEEMAKQKIHDDQFDEDDDITEN